MEFSKKIFWDIDYNTIDWKKNIRFVIERVLSRGSFNDWLYLKQLYGIEKLKEEVVHLRTLDKLNLNFCSIYFGIPKSEFRCYNNVASQQRL